MLNCVMENSEKYIKESAKQEAILDDNSVSHNLGGSKVIDDYLKKILLEATKGREMDHDQSLERI